MAKNLLSENLAALSVETVPRPQHTSNNYVNSVIGRVPLRSTQKVPSYHQMHVTSEVAKNLLSESLLAALNTHARPRHGLGLYYNTTLNALAPWE